jgi:molybdopterin adenylyltransferase
VSGGAGTDGAAAGTGTGTAGAAAGARPAPVPAVCRIRAAVVTVSDKGHAGLRADQSGPVLVELLRALGAEVGAPHLVPDEQDQIEALLRMLADGGTVDLVLTTGGTGLAPRDRTPEATLAVVERQAPGLPEAMRAASMAITPRAMLSRAAAGTRGRTLIVNMPGSPKACREHFAAIALALPHAVETLTGQAYECAQPAATRPGA